MEVKKDKDGVTIQVKACKRRAGGSKSITVYGVTVAETYERIINLFEALEKKEAVTITHYR